MQLLYEAEDSMASHAEPPSADTGHEDPRFLPGDISTASALQTHAAAVMMRVYDETSTVVPWRSGSSTRAQTYLHSRDMLFSDIDADAYTGLYSTLS